MDAIVISASPAHLSLALDEVGAALGRAPSQALAPGVARIEVEDAGAAARALAASAAVFVRHVAPITCRVELRGSPLDLDALVAGATGLLEARGGQARLGVQIRVLTGAAGGLRRQDVWARMAPVAMAARSLDTRHPEEVLSVIVAADEALLGLAPVAWHRSPWAGGERHFAHGVDAVSRAGFKLLEALEVFGLTPASGDLAVDLGAAPGGWTRVLNDAGLSVEAVDPARLDPRVLALPRVTHHRMRADRWLETRQGPPPAWLVSDMRMDAAEAATLLVRCAPSLAPSARLVTTLKLPERNLVAAMRRGLEVLDAAWRVEGVRHLFHNRSEVTVSAARR